MARGVTEEFVTRKLVKWLTDKGFQIICFDFPQSGMGRLIGHIKGEKNKGALLPDIVATKNSTCVVFENKNRFDKSDIAKIGLLKSNPDSKAFLGALLKGKLPTSYFYGIGLFLTEKELSKLDLPKVDVDFLITVDQDGRATIRMDTNSVF